MPNLLRLLNIRKISFVDAGAAIGAKVAFAKHKDPKMTLTPEQIAEITEKITKILQAPEADPKTEKVEVVKEGMAGMDPGALLEDALSDLPDDKKALIMALVGALHRSAPPEVAAPAPVAVEVEEAKAEDGQEADEGKAGDKPPIKPEEDEPMSKVLKGLTPEADEYIKALAATVEKQKKEIAEATEKIAKADVAKALAGQVEIAKSFTKVSGDIDKRASLLLGVLNTQGPEAHAELVRTLKSANEMINLDERGSARAGHVLDADGAVGEFEKLVKARMADKEEKYEIAYATVAKAHPKLYSAAKTQGQ